jgi:hypothetical protein
MRRTLSKLRPILHSSIKRNAVPDDFFIELENPHKSYNPGETVQGSVVLVLNKSQRVATISCGIQGVILIRNNLVKGKSVKHVLFEDSVVLWGEADKSAPPIRARRESRESISTHSTAHSTGSSSLASCLSTNSLDLEVSLTSTSQPMVVDNPRVNANRSSPSLVDSVNSSSAVEEVHPTLPRGEHVFAFEFNLPERGLFNSLEFERGAISYVITAIYNRSGPAVPAVTAEKALSIICPIDISTLPPPKVTSLTVDVHKKRKGHGSITLAVELPRRGYLRGESVPVKVSVQHFKHIRSVSGIIVTLSRISLVSAEGAEAQSFRKDLSQTISPLYTDPVTFFSTMTTNIRIPPETFPTTKGHQVISFQYCIEVVVDLAGKWDPSHRDTDPESSKLGVVDTDKLKRGKGVVSLWTEVVIGTFRGTDQKPRSSSLSAPRPPSINLVEPISSSLSLNSGPLRRSSPPSATSSVSNYQIMRYEDVAAQAHPESEKERLRLMEEALLPSNAPEPSAPSYEPSAPAANGEPSAPVLPELPELVPSAPDYHADVADIPGPSAPEYHTPSLHVEPSDKQELERIRLQEMASMPDEDYVPTYEPVAPEPNLEPSGLVRAGSVESLSANDRRAANNAHDV